MNPTTPDDPRKQAPLSVQEAVERRRSASAFDPGRPLPPALLERILRLATFAPSSMNLQPWRFLVVRTESNRRRLQTCARNQPRVGQAPAVIILLAAMEPDRSHLEVVLEQRLALGAVSPERAAELRARALASFAKHLDRILWATRSAMLAAATLMLTAESLGVASASIGGFDEEAIRREFGVPDDHAVCCLIALGYPAREDPFPGRLGLEEVCYEEHFGQPWKA